MYMKKLAVGALLAGVLVLVATGAFAAHKAPEGSLTQVAGKDGCWSPDASSEDGPGTCRNLRGGETAASIAISPDRDFVYLQSYGDFNTTPPSLSILRRNSKTGKLTQISGKKGCLSLDGSDEDGANECQKARNLDTGDGNGIAISSDGRFLYTAGQNTSSAGNEGIDIFKRDRATGTLKQLSGKKGCINPDGSQGCGKGREIDDLASVQLTPDQRYLYASNYNSEPTGGVAVFKRNSRNGTLHQLKGKNGCITQDGTTDTTGTHHPCRAGSAVGDGTALALPDNKYAYKDLYHYDLIVALKRNSKGGLVQLHGKDACISDDASSPTGPDTCHKGRGLINPWQVVASKGGKFLYSAGYLTGSSPPAIALFKRRSDGSLTQSSARSACISNDGSSIDGPNTCQDGRAILGAYPPLVSPNGKTLYVPQYEANSLDVFRVNPKRPVLQQLPGQKGCVSTDGSSEDGSHTCTDGRLTDGAYQVAATRDGDVYLADGGNGPSTGGIAIFHAAK
jgi:hypothetical protein